MANVLGNPVPMNTIEDTRTGSKNKIQLNIESAPDQTPSLTKPSLKSLIQEIGFSDKTPEYQASMKILEAISLTNTNQNQDEAETIDLISPVDSTKKELTEFLFKGKTIRKDEKNGKEIEDETTIEEQEKQTKDDNNNEEDKKNTQQTRNEKWRHHKKDKKSKVERECPRDCKLKRRGDLWYLIF